jgi:hypothetical protein
VSDLNEKIEERWRSRRKKGYNWPRLIAMLLILVALWYSLGVLKHMGSDESMIMSGQSDTLAVENAPGEQEP